VQPTSGHIDADLPTISIVDDDASVRLSLMDLFDSLDMSAASYESGDDFLSRGDLGRAGCILLDIHMPGMNGLNLQRKLMDAECMLPIVFMTGAATVPMSVQAMKRGASDFLLKPLDRSALVGATARAIRLNSEKRAASFDRKVTMAAVQTLTRREREVMQHVANGYLNKEIANELSVSEMMIKIHRSRMMKKMQVGSLAELIKKLDLASKEFDVYL
jgi:FixJ family two-component response regulator